MSAIEWRCEDEFEIDGVVYACRPFHDQFGSTPERFCLRKPPHIVRRLEALIRAGELRNIVELGVFEGGSTGFIAQATGPRKLICVDIGDGNEALDLMLEAKGLTGNVRPYWGVDQADARRLRSIVADELGSEPIDFVIDDASHLVWADPQELRGPVSSLATGGCLRD